MSRSDMTETAKDDEPFLSRWSRRKLETGREDPPQRQPLAEVPQEPEAEPPGDEAMPPLESLDEESDYSGFLSPNVSESLRRLALRRLFHSPQFNICDGLDDYAEDFSSFAPLGELVTAEMRRRMEQVAEKLESEAGEALAGSTQEGGEGQQAPPMAEEEINEEDEELG